MDQHITRPILWNVPDAFVVIMYLLTALWTAAIIYAAWRWISVVTLGQPEEGRFQQLPRRLILALRDSFGQGVVIRETWGWMHYSFYVAFVGLFIGTVIVLINDPSLGPVTPVQILLGKMGISTRFYYGDFYLVYKAAMDTFFLLLILGVLAEGARRAFRRPTTLNPPPAEKVIDNFENKLGYEIPMLMMVLVAITGLMLEGARINAQHPDFTEWAYLGRQIAKMEGAIGAGAMYHRTLWIVHVILVFGLLFCFPFTKLRHLFFAPLNLFFRNLHPRGRLAPIKDFENAETFGVSQVEQYGWKTLLDMASCLECGRCTINCPTVNTGKTLNPKFLVVEQREHLLQKAPFLLQRQALAATGATELPMYEGPDMITEVATEEAVWGCTTCGWCEEGCPVGIEHIQRIVDMRRHDVLMESRFPQEATSAFKGIENQGNPWGLAQEKRADWASGLEIPEMAELEDPSDIDVLYWVGCAGSYDERNQKVSRSFAGLMKQAGVKFAILGKEELCTGDPARRLGNEYLYATVAGQNVETLNRYQPRRIITQCPHCFHNLKNEYPDFGGNYQVMHEAEFLDELIKSGRLKPRNAVNERITYHDPCYMARHNRQWDGARNALRAIPGTEVEDIDQSKNRTFCCGAGGGCMWKEEHEGTRINQKRFDQISVANPKTLAVGCPFCMTMMEDALKSRSLEDSMRVRDLIEIVAESTEPQSK